MDKGLELLRELNSGELSLAQVRDAVIIHIRTREDIPNGVKGLLCNSRAGKSQGLILRAFNPILELLKIVENNKESEKQKKVREE